MARLDQTYSDLKRQLSEKGLTSEQQNEIKAKMTERENLLLPTYLQIALQYSDLHDRAGRMKAKGVIRMPLQWTNARRFFYWRLRRRLNEEFFLKRMAGAQSKEFVNRSNNLKTLAAWSDVSKFDNDDMSVAMWYEEHRKTIHEKIENLRSEGISYDVAALLRSDKDGGLRGVSQVLSMLPVEEKEEVLQWLSKQ